MQFMKCSVLCVFVAASFAHAQSTTRVSVSSAGDQANSYSSNYVSPAISANGRFVAFESFASNLVAGDTNGQRDVFVRDLQTGQTTRVSVSSAGVQVLQESVDPSISADGRFVAFESGSDQLVPGDVNGQQDVFVHDRLTGQTSLESVSSTGVQANNGSNQSTISGDGRFVAFVTFATNLVPGDTNALVDIFVRDRALGLTTRVSVSSTGAQANSHCGYSAISADGRFVTFTSDASNLVVADTNGTFDVFVHDRQLGATSRVSLSSAGAQADTGSLYAAAISATGRFVAFSSLASNLVAGDTNYVQDIFVHDRQTGQTTRESVSSAGEQANISSGTPSISDDGRFVAFHSSAINFVPGDTNGVRDIFVRDRQTSLTTRESLSTIGAQSDGESGSLALSGNGRFVAFFSVATNLVAGDTNGAADVFVRDLGHPADGDLNGDGVVNGADLSGLLSSWGPCAGCPADINGDGVVDGADLLILLVNWT